MIKEKTLNQYRNDLKDFWGENKILTNKEILIKKLENYIYNLKNNFMNEKKVINNLRITLKDLYK